MAESVGDDFGADWEAFDKTQPFYSIRYDAQGNRFAYNMATGEQSPRPMAPVGMVSQAEPGGEPDPKPLPASKIKPKLLKRFAARSKK